MSVTSEHRSPTPADRNVGEAAFEAAETTAETPGEMGVLIGNLARALAAIIATLVKRLNRNTSTQIVTMQAQIDQLSEGMRRRPKVVYTPPPCNCSTQESDTHDYDALKERIALLERRPATETIVHEREVIPFSWWAAFVGLLVGGFATYLLLPLVTASTVAVEMGSELQEVAIGSILEMQPIMIASSLLVGLIAAVIAGYLVGIPLHRRRDHATK